MAIKDGIRLYINLTNCCNVECPFCCMYSSPHKKTFMSFDTFKKIIDENTTQNETFELQLEGGEPTQHPDLYLFIEYAISTKKCSKIILLTNGINFNIHLKRIIDIKNFYNIPVEIKISVNYWLLKCEPKLLSNISSWVFAIENMKDINIIINARKRKEGDDNIDTLLEEYHLKDISHIYYLQSYGRLTNSSYDKPFVVQNIKSWKLFSSDGTCFEQDMIARSEYENKLE